MASAITHCLPRPATSFIGREAELAEVRRLMTTTRLLTLTGAGGSGKTRLALEAALRMAPEFPDGACLVELASLADPLLLPEALSCALGLCELNGDQTAEFVTDYLTDKAMLLVLDNCEHLITACATLADTLLRRCPGLRIFATSREALFLPWETVWPVPPLAPESEGVDLFTARARAVQPDFAPGPAVAEICRRLDGMPLAIELAAARVRVLSPEQIAARLDDSLRLLTGGSRTSPPRQQTLKAAVDWSYQTLPAPEQDLFRRLAVFAGFTLDAAEAVAGADALELLTQLVDKSLVVATPPRYRLLEPLRQYALAELKAHGAEAEARERHLAYYSGLAVQAMDHLLHSDQGAWLNRLSAEHDNLRLALEWSLDHIPHAGLRLAASIFRYWPLRGYLSEGRNWLELLLARCPEPGADRALGLLALAMLAQSDPRPLLEESCRLFRDIGDKRGLAWSMLMLGDLLYRQGDAQAAQQQVQAGKALCQELGDRVGLATAIPMDHIGTPEHAWQIQPDLEQALDLLRQEGEKAGIIRLLQTLAGMDLFERAFTRAAGRLDEAMQLAREIGDKQGLATASLGRGEIAHRMGHFEEARELYALALAHCQAIGDKIHALDATIFLGHVAVDMHDPARAKSLLTGAIRAIRELGATSWLSRPLTVMALAHLEAGEYEEAKATAEAALSTIREVSSAATGWGLRVLGIIAGRQGQFQAALQRQRESLEVDHRHKGSRAGLALGLCMTGVWLVHGGAAEQGLRLIAAADAAFPLNAALDPLERPYLGPALEAARTALGTEGYDRAWQRGARIPLDDALVEALTHQAKPKGLTAREVEITRLVAEGLSDREIAARLFISVRTVDTHLRNVFGKAEVESRTALAAWAIKNQI